MRKIRRLSDHSARVLQLFIDEPHVDRYGLEIIKFAGIPSGTLYPILGRFEDRGLIVGVWEEVGTAGRENRRPRRLYRLDPRAVDRASAELREWEQQGKRSRPPQTLRPEST
jgi:PadR family transcriptional regulator